MVVCWKETACDKEVFEMKKIGWKRIVRRMSAGAFVLALVAATGFGGFGMTAHATENAQYAGITIDGDESDWDAVAKTSVNENKGWDTVDEVAVVWDGDYIYLYFKAYGDGNGSGNWNSVTGGGPNNNGQYAFVTDLGKQLLIQLQTVDGQPAVSGVDGAMVAVNTQAWGEAPFVWEVAIPSSLLPEYNSTINFGFYLGETLISDIANMQGGEPEGSFDGVTYDGHYSDWDYYPHTTIEYATAGTHEHVTDAVGALYSTNGLLYGHVETNMPAHLAEAGGEFTYAVTIRLNGNENYQFYPRFVTVDESGNIDYNPQLLGLSQGTYEFYVIDTQGWGAEGASNISQIMEIENEYGNVYYGKMYVTVGASEDNMEFELDLVKIAAKFGLDGDSITTVEGQWGRIGQQWVSTAGTSTGAVVGVALCAAVAGFGVWQNKKRKSA